MASPPASRRAPRAESSGRAGARSAPGVSRHLRRRDVEQSVHPVELFFDLVYAFAVTQLSHLVINGHLRGVALGHAAFLLLVVWWAWIYTTWMANWFDPGSVPVRLVIAAVGLASLLMSAALPAAFGGQAFLFAGSYVALQLGRNVAAMILPGPEDPLRLVFARIVVWCCATSGLWLAGAVVSSLRYELWGAALVIDLLAPMLGYATPWLGRSQTSDWNVEGSHFAERFQGFIIIALGESIVVTGATASGHGLTGERDVAVGVAFATAAALWWLYFSEVAEKSRRRIAASDDPGRLARDAYTYLHLPIVAGIIVTAVGDDLLVTAPAKSLSATGVAMTVGGPAVYLLGEVLFRLRMAGRLSRKRVLAIAALAALGVAGVSLSALVLSSLVAGLLVALAIWEHESARETLHPDIAARAAAKR